MRPFADQTRVALALALCCLVGVAGLHSALSALRTARMRHAGLETAASGLRPRIADLLRDGEPIVATDPTAANHALLAVLRELAGRQNVLLEQGQRATGLPYRLAVARIVVSGDATHVLQFAEAVETHMPLIRFARWRLARAESGLQLEALAVAPWESRQ